jgi:hypothetical protein
VIPDDFDDSARLAYRSLINNTRTLEFSGFASNQRQQEGASCEKGRAAALHFSDNGQVSITSFFESSALQCYLDAETNDLYDGNLSPDKSQPMRRMIVLEDLPRNHVEILGSSLRIHPSFFASHYSDPIKTGSAGNGAYSRPTFSRLVCLSIPAIALYGNQRPRTRWGWSALPVEQSRST